MNNINSFRDIEKLKNYFFKLDAPYWTLYSGSLAERTKRIAVNNATKDLDQSFTWLSDLIYSLSDNGGLFHIHFKNSPKEDGDVKSLQEKAASRLTTNGFHVVFEAAPSGLSISKVNGPAHVGDIDRLVEEKVNAKMEILEKDMEIAALHETIAEQKKKSGIMGMPANEFLPFVFTAISQLKELIAANPNPQVRDLKIAGLEETHVKNYKKNIDNNNNESMNDSLTEFSDDEQEIIDDAIARMSAHIPDIVGVMERLANFVESKPEMAKTMLKNI